MSNDEAATVDAPPESSRRLTKRDLAERGIEALGPTAGRAVAISSEAGGVAFTTAMEVMEFGKMMAVAQQAIPPAFRNNPGMCVAVCFQAVEWRMSPFAVINKAYIVNDRLAYESQLIHAVVEARAPLEGRLRCSYVGEGVERQCLVEGMFTGETHPHEYTSPKIKDIKIQNSPLWKADPDQQLWYYASRAWARKWCPDVLMGIYSKDELRENPRIDREDDPVGPGLHQRLNSGERGPEGHQPGHAERELANIAGGGSGGPVTIDHEDAPADEPTEDDAKSTKAKGGGAKRRKGAKESSGPAAAKKETAAPADKGPQTAAQYETYARKWIAGEKDPEAAAERWEQEMEMRDDLSVPISTRNKLQELLSETHGV